MSSYTYLYLNSSHFKLSFLKGGLLSMISIPEGVIIAIHKIDVKNIVISKND
jgi:hypothetical protein